MNIPIITWSFWFWWWRRWRWWWWIIMFSTWRLLYYWMWTIRCSNKIFELFETFSRLLINQILLRNICWWCLSFSSWWIRITFHRYDLMSNKVTKENADNYNEYTHLSFSSYEMSKGTFLSVFSLFVVVYNDLLFCFLFVFVSNKNKKESVIIYVLTFSYYKYQLLYSIFSHTLSNRQTSWLIHLRVCVYTLKFKANTLTVELNGVQRRTKKKRWRTLNPHHWNI